MSEATKGVFAVIAACVIWGLSPLYYKMITHVPPLEVLSHRTIWSLVFFSAILLVQGRLAEVATLIKTRRGLVMTGFAALMISLNWFIFIVSIQIGRAVESSLGYYIFPLVAVVLGMFAFKERLNPGQWVSVALAALAVIVLSVGLGAAPWISLVIALSFGLYGLVKKRTTAGPVVSVTAEVLVLAPVALVWLIGVHYLGFGGAGGGVFGHDLRDSLILAASGPLTAGPLILFSYASRRNRMTTLGLVQYLNPSLQFFCAVVIFGEVLTPWHAVALPMIWVALALYSGLAIVQERNERKAAVRAATSGTTLT